MLGWYFMFIIAASPPNLHADYMGPYPTKAVCEAAREGAQKFEKDYMMAPWKQYSTGEYAVQHRFQECTDDAFVFDAQWSEEIDNQKYYDGGGVW